MSKTKPKLTPWFPGNARPVRKGVYQRCYSTGRPTAGSWIFYCYWDGKLWMTYENNPIQAAANKLPSSYQSEWWRGLAEPPK